MLTLNHSRLFRWKAQHCSRWILGYPSENCWAEDIVSVIYQYICISNILTEILASTGISDRILMRGRALALYEISEGNGTCSAGNEKGKLEA